MASDFAVKTTFDAGGNINKVLKAMNNNTKRFGNTASKSFKKASRSAEGFGNVFKGVLSAGLVQRGIGALTQLLSGAATGFVEFDQAIVSASAKFKDMNLETAKGQKQFQAIKESARQVGATTEFTSAQAAEGLKFFAQAGFTSEQAMASLAATVDLATASELDLGRATDIATDSLGQFGLMTKDATQLEKNLNRITDVFAVTAAQTNTSIEDLFETVRLSGANFKAAGQSVETFTAFAGILANAGIKGSQAATVMKNSILNLAAPTKQMATQLKSLGIKVSTGEGKFKDMADIMDDVKKGMVGFNREQKLVALNAVFGKRAITGINVVLDTGVDEVRRLRSAMLAAGGSLKKMAAIMRASLQNRLKILGSTFQSVVDTVLTEFQPQIESAITSIIKFIKSFDTQRIINFIKFTIKIAKAIERLSPLILPVVAVMAAWATGLKAVAIAQGILNVVMTANPIGLIIVGVAALIGIIMLLADNWGIVGKEFEQVWGNIKKIFFSVLAVMGAAWFTFIKGILSLLGLIGGAIGFDTTKLDAALAKVQGFQDKIIEGSFAGPEGFTQAPPNQVSAEALGQRVGFSGQLDITGAPEGSTLKTQTRGAPPIQANLLGANP